MAPVTVEILSLYSFAFKFPLLPLAFTMVKFDPAVVSAATLGNKRYESVTLGSASSEPNILECRTTAAMLLKDNTQILKAHGQFFDHAGSQSS